MWCGRPLSPPGLIAAQLLPTSQPAHLNPIIEDVRRMYLAIAGAIILALGVFAPLVSVPILGSVNYIYNGRGDGMIILVLAGISLALALTGKYRGLWFTALASLALMSYTFFALRGTLQRIENDPDNVFILPFQMSWGWAVLIVGVGLLIGAAAWSRTVRKVHCPNCHTYRAHVVSWREDPMTGRAIGDPPALYAIFGVLLFLSVAILLGIVYKVYFYTITGNTWVSIAIPGAIMAAGLATYAFYKVRKHRESRSRVVSLCTCEQCAYQWNA
ncbi:MAG TPA: hypothetical protein VJ183_09025 [Chloroflexia bacterium]|nr:hypothetical protein [Chloroflexia bacterium]